MERTWGFWTITRSYLFELPTVAAKLRTGLESRYPGRTDFEVVPEVKNTSGSPLYHLILATDNQAGSTIMSDVYRKAARQHEAMRREALERRRLIREDPQFILFTAEQLASTGPAEDVTYVHQPPWLPYGSAPE